MKFLVIALLALAPLGAQTWTDRAEYDLAMAARQQSAPAARLKVLSEWSAKYPASAMRHARAELMLAAAQSVNDTTTMLAAAHDMLTADPTSFTGLYWITVLQPTVGTAGAESVGKAESAAKKLLEQSPAFFSSPASRLSGDAAASARTRVEALAKRTLGWVAWQQANMDEAEKLLRASLSTDASSALTSAWLGTAVASRKLPERQPEAIWHLARAAFLDGDSALPPAQRRGVRELLDAVYANYHGSADGLDEIGQKTRASSEPPADFKIDSAAEVAQRLQDEELSRTNPELLQWLKIRRRLIASDGETQFAALNGTAVEGLRGYVVRCNPASKPTEIVLGLTDVQLEEVLLKIDAAFPKCAEPGTPITFGGTLSAFTREPFLLTISAAKQAVEGWPGQERKR